MTRSVAIFQSNETGRNWRKRYSICGWIESCCLCYFVSALRISKWYRTNNPIRFDGIKICILFSKSWAKINSSFANLPQFCLIFAFISSIIGFFSNSIGFCFDYEVKSVFCLYYICKLICLNSVWATCERKVLKVHHRDMTTIPSEAEWNQFYS